MVNIFYNCNMDITGWTNKEIVQVLIARNKISQKELIKRLEENNNQQIPQSTFANRLLREGMRVRELQEICDALNYSIILQPKNNPNTGSH